MHTKRVGKPYDIAKSAHAAPRIGGSLDVFPSAEGGGTLTAKRWPTVAGMCRTWPAGLGALGDAAGLTRAELARRTGVAATRISEYARPRPGRADPANMTLRTARALARALGVTIDALYDTMAMRIPENGPTARQAGTSDPARRA
ncbi:Helix-turn-helix [Bifidobacterium longum subsp. infantis]|uniref:Helix-turn-helix n=2 Tax=Bifidobacterium longum TaxID=216816 RepID=A0A564W0G5_BIFLI|nr:Helix-turn-helix [Bifidobacterium longum subsp. infantis]